MKNELARKFTKEFNDLMAKYGLTPKNSTWDGVMCNFEKKHYMSYYIYVNNEKELILSKPWSGRLT